MKVAMDIVSAVPILGDHDHITRARQVLREDAFREAYIVDAKGRCIGYIDITDALRVNATRSNVTLEGYVKTAAVVTPEDTLEMVAAAVIRSRTDSAAVVDTDGKLIGGILVSDLFPIVLSRHEPKGKVADCMSRKVVTADASDPLQRVYTLIIESGYTAFPVMKKHMLIGMISRRDLLDAGHAPEDAGRTTFSTHLGIAGAETRVRELVANATAALSVFGDEAVALKALAEYVGIRKQ